MNDFIERNFSLLILAAGIIFIGSVIGSVSVWGNILDSNQNLQISIDLDKDYKKNTILFLNKIKELEQSEKELLQIDSDLSQENQFLISWNTDVMHENDSLKLEYEIGTPTIKKL